MEKAVFQHLCDIEDPYAKGLKKIELAKAAFNNLKTEDFAFEQYSAQYYTKKNKRFDYAYRHLLNLLRYPTALKQKIAEERAKREAAEDPNAEKSIAIISSTESEPEEDVQINTSVPGGIEKVPEKDSDPSEEDKESANEQTFEPKPDASIGQAIDETQAFWVALDSENNPLRQIRRHMKQAEKEK